MSRNNHWLCFLQLSKAFHSRNKCGTKYHESKRNIPYNESSEFVALRFREFTSSLNGEIREEEKKKVRKNEKTDKKGIEGMENLVRVHRERAREILQ